MGANTPNRNMYLPGGGSSGLITPDEVADIDRLNENFKILDLWSGTVDAAVGVLSTTNRAYYGLAANKAGLAGPLHLGDTYQETDKGLVLWWYDGTNWVPKEPTLRRVHPSGVTGTGATLSDNGDIVLAAAAGDIVINGCVPAGTKELHIGLHIETTGLDYVPGMRLRAAGANLGGTTYFSIYTDNHIGLGPSRREDASVDKFTIGRISASGGFAKVRLNNPLSTTAPKRFMTFESFDGTAYSFAGGGTVTTSTAADGISIVLPASSNTAGVIRIDALI